VWPMAAHAGHTPAAAKQARDDGCANAGARARDEGVPGLR